MSNPFRTATFRNSGARRWQLNEDAALGCHPWGWNLTVYVWRGTECLGLESVPITRNKARVFLSMLESERAGQEGKEK